MVCGPYSRSCPECLQMEICRQSSAGSALPAGQDGRDGESRAATVMVPVSELLPSDSPRLRGEDAEHVRLLAEADEWPPLLVRRSTMRVIDGMHRLRAAQLTGQSRVPVRFFDGTEEAAFVAAVRLNAEHGLPLSRADRLGAAARIIASHPQWSDRRIAETTGLGASSVASVRARSTAPHEQLKIRVGRDGRARPLDPAAGRLQASRLIAAKPGSTLKEIAEQAGISVATAKDVRDRVRAGQDPLPRKQRDAVAHGARPGSGAGMIGARSDGRAPAPASIDLSAVLERMLRDPSMRTDTGRALLQLLRPHAEGKWSQLAAGVPEHRAATVARAAKLCAEQWLRLAQQLEAVHAE